MCSPRMCSPRMPLPLERERGMSLTSTDSSVMSSTDSLCYTHSLTHSLTHSRTCSHSLALTHTHTDTHKPGATGASCRATILVCVCARTRVYRYMFMIGRLESSSCRITGAVAQEPSHGSSAYTLVPSFVCLSHSLTERER
jgi:hypothetical protein